MHRDKFVIAAVLSVALHALGVYMAVQYALPRNSKLEAAPPGEPGGTVLGPHPTARQQSQDQEARSPGDACGGPTLHGTVPGSAHRTAHGSALGSRMVKHAPPPSSPPGKRSRRPRPGSGR